MFMLTHRHPVARFFFALLAIAALVTLVACEEEKEPKKVENCLDNFKAAEGKNKTEGDKYTCICPEGSQAGQIWGSDTYSINSSICRAAAHVGAIGKSGGEVVVHKVDGCPNYPASTQNSIPSSAGNEAEASIYFDGHGDGACSENCPPRFADVPELENGTEVTCECTPAQISASVWGTVRYPQESSICAAAVHAGVLPKTGGKVTAKATLGCFHYLESEENGIKSGRWGESALSFFFPQRGSTECVNLCPVAFRFVPGADENTEMTCTCASENTGSVFGNGVYAQESSICLAAIHAGALAPGTVADVNVKGMPTCELGYLGTKANGVNSEERARSDISFYFPGHAPKGEVPKGSPEGTEAPVVCPVLENK